MSALSRRCTKLVSIYLYSCHEVYFLYIFHRNCQCDLHKVLHQISETSSSIRTAPQATPLVTLVLCACIHISGFGMILLILCGFVHTTLPYQFLCCSRECCPPSGCHQIQHVNCFLSLLLSLTSSSTMNKNIQQFITHNTNFKNAVLAYHVDSLSL